MVNPAAPLVIERNLTVCSCLTVEGLRVTMIGNLYRSSFPISFQTKTTAVNGGGFLAYRVAANALCFMVAPILDAESATGFLINLRVKAAWIRFTHNRDALEGA